MDFLDNKVWQVFDFESQDSAWRMSLHLNSDSRAYSTQRASSGSQCLSGFCPESQRLSGFCSRSQPLSGFCQRASICKHSARGDSTESEGVLLAGSVLWLQDLGVLLAGSVWWLQDLAICSFSSKFSKSVPDTAHFCGVAFP